jgi:hypothetical protein
MTGVHRNTLFCCSGFPYPLTQPTSSALLDSKYQTTDPVSGELFCARKQGIFLLQRMRHAETSSKKNLYR